MYGFSFGDDENVLKLEYVHVQKNEAGSLS